jgi:type IV secretory pathway component VirB8
MKIPFLSDPDAVEFEARLNQSNHRSSMVAWVVAAVMGGVAIVESVAMVVMAAQSGTVPYVVYIDKETGAHLQVAANADGRDLMLDGVSAEYWSRKYVTSRESYAYRLLQGDYDFVMASTLDTIAKEYDSIYAPGPNKKDDKLRDSVEERVEIVSVVHQPDAVGRVTVRFKKTTYKTGSMQPEREEPFVASLAFEFGSTKGWNKKTKQINPFGFTVTAYRVSPELEVVRK